MKKILVIEDEKFVRENIKTLLTEEGYKVYESKDGKEGIEIAKQQLPDLIICDILMPHKDGYSVLKALSKDDRTKKIPFIFLTAKVETSDLRAGMELGADDYLFKPFKMDELLKSIHARLKRIEALKDDFEKEPKKITTKKYSAEDKVFISINGKPKYIKINSIVFIAAENQYTSLNLAGEKSFLLRKSISKWEEILPDNLFFRIHRSTIVNLEYLLKIEKWYNSGFLIRLKGVDEPFVISKRYATKIRNKLM